CCRHGGFSLSSGLGPPARRPCADSPITPLLLDDYRAFDAPITWLPRCSSDASRFADRAGASLSDAAGTLGCRVYSRRWERHLRAFDGSMAARAIRTTIRH